MMDFSPTVTEIACESSYLQMKRRGNSVKILLKESRRFHESGGIFHAPQTASSAEATDNTCSSSHGLPTICTPMGKPSGARLTGTTAAGLPSRKEFRVAPGV